MCIRDSSLHYLQSTENQIGHIKNIQRIPEADYVWLDRFTIQNLELLSSAKETGRSFIEVLDHSITPMGSRMMRCV